MSEKPGDAPATRDEVREILREQFRGSGGLVPKGQAPERVSGEFSAVRNEFVTRAELRELIGDKTAQFVEKTDFARLETTVDNLKENIPSKEIVTRADTNAGIAVKGICAIIAGMIGIAVYVARKTLFGE